MKIKLKKILSLVFVLCVFAAASFTTVNAVSYSNDVSTKSKSIIFVNMDTDQVVYEKNADEKRYPASTTKIMTYIIAAENIDDFENTKIPIKQSVLDTLNGTGSSLANVGSHVGKSMTAIDLLYSMMVPSGNDAAVVLADYVGGGSIDKFVEMMNEKAEELGCENTNFVNPDGLHDENHYTTARDMYKITNYALTLPEFSEITNTTSYYCDGDTYPLLTTNYLIDQSRGGEYYYMYAKGIKTGTTDEAGRCLVTTASADGYSYMAVLLGAPYTEGEYEEYDTFTDAADLFRWALTELQLYTVATTETPICEEKVNLAWDKETVQLVPETNFSAIVPKDIEAKDLVYETDLPESIDAPVDTETVVGTATVYYKDSQTGEKQELTKVNLVASENIDRSGFLYVLNVLGTLFASYWFIIVVALIVLILIIYFIISKIHRARSKKRRRVKNYRNF